MLIAVLLNFKAFFAQHRLTSLILLFVSSAALPLVQAGLHTAEHNQELLLAPDEGGQNLNSKKVERIVLESSHVFKCIRMDMKRLFSLAEKDITKTSTWKVMPSEFKLT